MGLSDADDRRTAGRVERLVGSSAPPAGLNRDATSPPWLATHPIVGSVVIAIVVTCALQVTHAIDLEERLGPVVGWNLPARFGDVVFRMAMGAIAVIGVIPAILGYWRRRPWLRRYLRHMRLTLGIDRWRTMAVSGLSVGALIAIMVGLGLRFGVLRGDLDFIADESRWFVVVLMLVPGLWEEMAFRGVILANLQQRYRRWIAVAVSSLLFGLAHVSMALTEGLDDVLPLMLLSAAVAVPWGYAVAKTGSLLPAIVSHYAMNVGIVLLLAPDMGDEASAAVFGSLAVVYPIVTMLGVWLLYRVRSRVPNHTAISHNTTSIAPS